MARILYIEHATERHEYQNALQKAIDGGPVDIITYPSAENLTKHLKQNRYDLVVTDAFFLPANHNHEDSSAKEEYLLGEVVRHVRDIEGNRTKIAVLTEFSDEMFSGRYRDDLGKVDYLWEKASSPDNFIVWQVKRLLEDQRSSQPEHVILTKLIDLLENPGNTQANLPWKDHIIKMIDAYRRSNLEVQQINDIRSSLLKIADLIGIEAEFNTVYGIIQDAEPLNVAANPFAWGHLRHTINVFWLGYYLLNSGMFDLNKIGKRIFRDYSDYNDLNAATAVNSAWFIASIFHDVGLLGQRLPELLERCSDIFKIYPYADIKLPSPPCLSDPNTHLAEYITALNTMTSGDVSKWFSACLKGLNQKTDHGLLSSATLLNIFKDCNDNNVKMISDAASLAVSVHNLFNVGYKESVTAHKKTTPKLMWDEYPLVSLLIFCDQIQIWDRQTGLENKYSKLSLECCEIQNITSTNKGKSGIDINFVLNYVPFRDVYPGDTKDISIQKEILSILVDKIKPVLNKLIFTKSNCSNISIDFKYDNREILTTWKIPKQ